MGAAAKAQGQEQQFEINWRTGRGLASHAGDGSGAFVHHRLDKATYLRLRIDIRPERAEGAALQFMAEEGAEPSSRKPEDGSDGFILKNEGIGESVAQGTRLDLAAFGCRALSAESVPVLKDEARACVLHADTQ